MSHNETSDLPAYKVTCDTYSSIDYYRNFRLPTGKEGLVLFHVSRQSLEMSYMFQYSHEENEISFVKNV